MKQVFQGSILICTLIISGLCAPLLAQSAPQIEFDAAKAGPRAIEDLTSQSVPRDYGLAWQTLAQALNENRAALLDGYFTGFARNNLMQRVRQQQEAGLHVRYTDRGHKLSVLFYSPNGDAMQLRDDAQFEVQTFDGNKVIEEHTAHARYFVLMTPGADRWMVRDLVSVPSEGTERGD